MPRGRNDPLALNNEAGVEFNKNRDSSALNPMHLDYYKPSYKTLNYTTWKTDPSGQVNFYDTIAHYGEKKLAEIKDTVDNLELTQKYNEVNQKMLAKSIDFKRNSETGEGYLEAMSAYHKQLNDEVLSGVFDPVKAGKLQNLLARSKADWENSAFKEEQEMRTAYTLREAEHQINELCLNVFNNPAGLDTTILAAGHALESYRNVAGEQAYEKVLDSAKKNLVYSYGLGLVDKNPYGFEELTQNANLAVLSPTQIMNLQNLAKSEISKRESAVKKLEHEAKKAEATGQIVTMTNMLKKMVEDPGSVSTQDIQNSGLTTEQKEQLKEGKNGLTKAYNEQLLFWDGVIKDVGTGRGIGHFRANEQKAVVEELTPVGEGGKTDGDRVKTAIALDANYRDAELSNRLMDSALYSENAEEVLKALGTIKLARDSNSKIITKPTADEQQMLDYMELHGSETPKRALAAQQDIKELIKQKNNNPSLQERIEAEGRKDIYSDPNNPTKSDYTKEFKTARNVVAKHVAEDLNLKSDAYTTKKMRTEAEKLLVKYRLQGFSLGDAGALAERDISRSYGRTNLLPDKPVMENPPEKTAHQTVKQLKETFQNGLSSGFKPYTGGKIERSGYQIELDTNGEYPTARYITPYGEEGKAPFTLEYNEEVDGYIVAAVIDGFPFVITDKDSFEPYILDFRRQYV